MFLMSSSSTLLLPLFLIFQIVYAGGNPHALSVIPSLTWYGDDGSWSAVSLRVGSPQQWVDVMVSTASSETWVVSPFGCDTSATCQTKRGGLFDSKKSNTWQSQGSYGLGLDPQLGYTGVGDYGLDIVEFGSTGVSMNRSMIAALNGTQYWLGYLGLGIDPANFTTIIALSPISDLVETEGAIPSHSYGFTAGAIYQGKSEPCSLTLGGYDANRFIAHNISFELNPHAQPQAFLQSITIGSKSSASGPRNWTSNPLPLIEPGDGMSIIIDSSTPFLWLPESVCENFALALGLTYNETLDLYTFDGNASKRSDLQSWNLEFTFSLTDTSKPSQMVNITLPYAAFDLQLTFPYIPNTTYGAADSSKYYFPLRKAANDTQYTIGRAFLQEAYIITDYERNNFSVYQVAHIGNPLGNTSIVDISRPSTSHYSPPAGTTEVGLSKTAIILIAVGVVLFVSVVVAVSVYFGRRRRKGAVISESEPPPASRPATAKKQEVEYPVHEADINIAVPPAEIAGDTIRIELDVPQTPVELDSTNISRINGTNFAGIDHILERQPERQPERRPVWNDDSVSERSPGGVSSYRSGGTNVFSAVSSAESTIVNYSSLSPPPPRYQTLAERVERVERPQESERLQGHIYGRHRRFGTGKAGVGSSTDATAK